MPLKTSTTLFTFLILSTLIILYLNSSFLSLTSPTPPIKVPNFLTHASHNQCNLFKGKWILDPNKKPMYDETCPFHRNAWNCLKNRREKMSVINSWKWVPENCSLGKIDPFEFLGMMRNKNLGFVGDSLNENFLVSFICLLRVADSGAKKWKKMGSWRGAYFPKFNVTVAYHRAVLLSKYQWQEAKSDQDGLKGIYRVDVDIPANDWVHITKFYDVLVFNTGHWTLLIFALNNLCLSLDFLDGLKVVLKSMISHIDEEVPSSTLNLWRLQSPRHFYGGEWNQNGSCLFDELLEEPQEFLVQSSQIACLDSKIWRENNNGVNKEARQLNQVIEEVLRGTNIQMCDLAHLSEYRADAHPAIWLGKKDAVAVWGQDCMHWCLPGVPDTWSDILAELIRRNFVGNTLSV